LAITSINLSLTNIYLALTLTINGTIFQWHNSYLGMPMWVISVQNSVHSKKIKVSSLVVSKHSVLDLN